MIVFIDNLSTKKQFNCEFHGLKNDDKEDTRNYFRPTTQLITPDIESSWLELNHKVCVLHKT